MKCPITECSRHDDCGILDITNKIPVSKLKCSYFVKFQREQIKPETPVAPPPKTKPKTTFKRRSTPEK